MKARLEYAGRVVKAGTLAAAHVWPPALGLDSPEGTGATGPS